MPSEFTFAVPKAAATSTVALLAGTTRRRRAGNFRGGRRQARKDKMLGSAAYNSQVRAVLALRFADEESARTIMNEDAANLMSRISGFAAAGAAAREHGEEPIAEEYFRAGFNLAMEAIEGVL